MYLRHFKLTAEPFALTPDPAFLYASEGHSEALAALKLGLLERRGLIVMVGEVGTGKTTLLYSLLSRLGPQIKTAFVPNSMLSFDGMLRAALKDFGVELQGPTRLDLLNSLNEFLRQCDEQNATAAIVIDEAQNLSDAAFEELRMLSNYETYKHKLLQIVLVGQPELDAKLNKPELRQVKERVAVRCVVNPLSPSDCQDYVAHRLGEVGGSLEIFHPAALGLIVKKSEGIPRRINILCHNTMLYAYGRNMARITKSLVATAMRERDGSDLVRVGRKGLAAWLDRLNGKHTSRFLYGIAWTAAGLTIGAIGTVALLSGGTPNDRAAGKDAATATIVGSIPAEAIAHTKAATIAPVQAELPAPIGVETYASAETAEAEELAHEAEAIATPEPEAPEVIIEADDTAAVVEEEAEAVDVAELEPHEIILEAGDDDTAAIQEQVEAVEADEPETHEIIVETGDDNAASLEEDTEIAAEIAEQVDQDTATDEPSVDAAASLDPVPEAQPNETTTVTPTEIQTEPGAAGELEPESRNSQPAAEQPDSAKLVRVLPGNTLFELSLDVYGDYSPALMNKVRNANPHIKNPDFIRAGDRLRFPALGDDPAPTPTVVRVDSSAAAANAGERRLFEEFRAKAEEGDVHARYNLGVLYHRGTGVRQSHILAVHWYRLAALEGLDVAQNNLGFMYEAGSGVERDLATAASWYRKAADQGYGKAQINLCELFRDGRGVSKDLAAAYLWCDRAAESGDPAAIAERDRIANELPPASIERIRSTSSAGTDANAMIARDGTRLTESQHGYGTAREDQHE